MITTDSPSSVFSFVRFPFWHCWNSQIALALQKRARDRCGATKLPLLPICAFSPQLDARTIVNSRACGNSSRFKHFFVRIHQTIRWDFQLLAKFLATTVSFSGSGSEINHEPARNERLATRLWLGNSCRITRWIRDDVALRVLSQHDHDRTAVCSVAGRMKKNGVNNPLAYYHLISVHKPVV